MQVLRNKFRKDLLVWLILVILIGSGLATAIGYLADSYFGDTVDGLLGGYGEYDFLLTINQELRDSAYKEVKQIISNRFPGSKLKEGVTVAGKANYFLKLDDSFRNREVFSQFEKEFEQVVGLENVSLITEPKLSLRGMLGNTNEILGDKVSALQEVDFVLTAGSGLDVILNPNANPKRVERKIEDILDKHKVLQIRFPIEKESRELTDLNTGLRQQLEKEFSGQNLQSLNAGQRENLDDLIKTMNQMKKFLLEYATIVRVKIPDDLKMNKSLSLAMAGGDVPLSIGQKISSKTILLSPLQKEEGVLKAIISRGDGAQILNQDVYLIGSSGRVIKKIGKSEVKRPRYLLKKAANETEKVLPQLNSILTNTEEVNQRLLQWLTNYEKGLGKIQGLQQKLTEEQGKLNNFVLSNQEDLKELLEIVTRITDITTRLEETLSKLEFLQQELLGMSSNFKDFERDLERQMVFLTLAGVEDKRLTKLKDSIHTMRQQITGNMDSIISKINRYNPLLNKFRYWNNNLEKLKKVLQVSQSKSMQPEKVEELLNVVSKDINKTINGLDEVERTKLKDRLVNLKDSLTKLEGLNLTLVSKQLGRMQQALPNLKDEEITGTIKLLDKYLAGQVLPGEAIYFLVNDDVNKQKLQKEVNNYFNDQKIDQLFTEAGIIKPNIRGELFKILGEVRVTLTALIALIFTALVLLIDQSLVMITMQRMNQESDNRLSRFLNSSYLYGFLLGGLLLSAIFYLSQAKFPYMSLEYIFIIGGLLGVLSANKAVAINPIDESEILAGEALGLNYTEIMHEIVIPNGRPGFLTLLNRKEMIFR